MSATAPTFNQVKAQIAAVRRKVDGARVIGINATGRWTGERVQRDGDETYMIDQCDSPLQMRIALRDDPGNVTKVLITELHESQLDDDILVRLTKRRLFVIDSWQIVKSLFDARTVDPRVTPNAWIADELLALSPTQGYAPAAGGFLDAERVWGVLLRDRLGLPTGRPDLIAILRWSTDPAGIDRWHQADQRFQAAATDWMTQTAGPAAEQVLACVSQQEAPEAAAIGLACGVVFSRESRGKIDKAVGKMEERYFGGMTPTDAIIERWHAAAQELVRIQLTDLKTRRNLLSRADAIITEVGAADFAYTSDTSPMGFDQRLARFGDQLVAILDVKSVTAESLEPLAVLRDSVLDHDRARHETRRVERIDMALRLLRWIQAGGPQTGSHQASLSAAAGYHLDEGGFIDWGRRTLWAGDPVRDLSEAYSLLFARVTEDREQHARHFAELLRDWTQAGADGAEVIPVERALAEVVAPLASSVPVLVILVDGMSAAVWRELLDDLTNRDWTALVPEGAKRNPPAMATVPSVTAVSRTSLFCGALRRGAAKDEQKGFASHPELVAQCQAGHPPVLFHKASLAEEDDVVLADEIRKAIESSRRRVVGVVVNAVDDHLAKGDQIDVPWTRDAIRVLPSLLHEASTAGRLVVLLSDHGHVLDHGTTARIHEDAGERWRPDDGKPGQDEIRIQGPRVVVDGDSLIASWSEGIRYTAVKKNGYHGGLSPQEMVIPITVLTRDVSPPQGWADAPVDSPAWWDEVVVETADTYQETKKVPGESGAGMLFPIEDEPQVEPSSENVGKDSPARPEWIQSLLTSELFAEQKSLGGRTAPSDDVLIRLLTALDARGGKMTTTALARSLGRSSHRLAGVLAVAQRVLNVDGYAVLTRDESSNTVEFNRPLLCKQFDLE